MGATTETKFNIIKQFHNNVPIYYVKVNMQEHLPRGHFRKLSLLMISIKLFIFKVLNI